MRQARASWAILLLAWVARADGVTDAADKVVEAFEGRQPLGALAALEDPDPWRVADELCHRGKLGAAKAFAEAAPRADTKGLPAYVAAAGTRKDEPGAREALAAYREAYDGKKSPAAQLATLAGIRGDREDVTSCRIHYTRGWACVDSQKFAEAEASWQRSGDIAKRLGWLSCAEEAYNGAAEYALATGDLDGAQACAEAQLEVSTDRSNAIAAVYARNTIGICHEQRGNYDLALRQYQETLESARQAGMAEFAAAIQLNMVNVLVARGEYDRAIEVGEEARAVFDAAQDKANMAKIRAGLASVHVQRGELEGGKALYEAAYATFSQLGSPEAAICLLNIANIEAGAGDVRAAVDKLETLSEVFAARQDLRRAGQCRSALATVYRDLADYDRAIVELQGALQMLERVGDQGTIAFAHHQLGMVRHQRGQTDLALSEYETALDLYRKIGAPKGVASVLSSRGTLYWNIGEDEKAGKMLREAHRVFEEIGDRRSAARTLGALAAILADRDRPEEAAKALEGVVEAHRSNHDSQAEALALENLALRYFQMGKDEAALHCMEQAIEKGEKLGDLAGKASALVTAGSIQARLGRLDQAFETLQKGTELAGEIGAQSVLLAGLTASAQARLRNGDPEKALALARRARDSLPGLVRGLGDEEGAAARSFLGDVFEVGATAALERRDAAAACLFLESGRAGSLLEALGGRDSLRGAVIPEGLRVLEAKSEKSVEAWAERCRAATAAGEFKPAREARKQLATASSELLDVQDRIRREAKRAAHVLYPDVKSLAEIQAALRGDEALVVYGIYTRSQALVVRNDGARVVPLDLGKDLEASCADLKLHSREAPYADALDRLRDQVVAPLELPASVRRVLVSPQGALAYVPAALLFPGKDVVYVPSGTTYLHLREEAAGGGADVLALGDPDYRVMGTAGGGLRRVGDMQLTPLPATRAEAETVGTVTLLGGNATEEMLRGKLGSRKRWHAVHFACHGVVNPEYPRLSALALTQAGDDDGLLSVLEVYRMEVPADLVVLSACETGRGKVYRAEGVVGFTRAFMFAGAPRVVVSLWEVDDEATSALMVNFYALWKEGRSAAGALREAQESVAAQEKWKHPLFWAAWQLWGLPD